MDITQVKVFPVQEEKLKAFVSVVFDHCFMVNDIKVIQGKDGLFLSMPSRRKKNGEFKDVAHPLNNETRRKLEVQVLAEYRQVVDDPTPRRPDRAPEDAAAESAAPAPAAASPVDEPPAATSPVDEPPAAAPPAAAPPAAAPPVAPSTTELPVPASSAAESPTTPGEPEAAAEDDDESEKSLQEVQEMHLRDSFWQVS